MNRILADSQYELTRDDMPSALCFRAENNGCMPHFHASIELVYVQSGRMMAILDGQTYAVDAGRLLLTGSYAVHAYYTEPDQQNQVIVVIIPLSIVPSLQKKLNKKNFRQAVYNAEQDDDLSAILPLIAEHADEYSQDTMKGFSYFLLGMLISRIGLNDQPTNRQSILMRDVLIYLQNHYQQPLRMESLARQFGYSRSRFSRLFHDHLGCSMIEYLSALRCREAARLLLESDMTMLDAALKVGFECLRTFYRAFKACYHMTPSQYVRAHTESADSLERNA